MRQLLLIRHAKSSWKYPELKDHQRPLNKRGRRDAPMMGKVLNEKPLKLEALRVSTAIRAIATAHFLQKALDYQVPDYEAVDALYHAKPQDMLAVIRNTIPSETQTVALVGHNPGMADLADQLLPYTQNLSFPTCSIAAIDFNFGTWSKVSKGTGQLRFYEYPKKYTHT